MSIDFWQTLVQRVLYCLDFLTVVCYWGMLLSISQSVNF